jgi:hypothetical protein
MRLSDSLEVPHMPMSDQLCEAISRALAGQDDPNARAYAAAVVILRHHLGDDFIAKKVAHSEQPDPFLLNDLRPEASTRQAHMTRVTELADFLFLLDGTPGFGALINRLRTRDIAPVFSDAEAAATFQRNGYSVTVTHERGILGQDFDFSAVKDGKAINVEVTTTGAISFRPNAIRNIIKKKRRQVPKGSAAGLFVVIPPSWPDAVPDLQNQLVEATRDVFRKSARFNFVSYLWHADQEHGDVTVTATVSVPVVNDNAACASPDLSPLTAEAADADLIRKALAEGTQLEANPEEHLDFMLHWNKWSKRKGAQLSEPHA